MNKQELEDKLSNGITGYPSFDNSVIKNCDIEKQKVKE